MQEWITQSVSLFQQLQHINGHLYLNFLLEEGSQNPSQAHLNYHQDGENNLIQYNYPPHQELG